MRLSNFVGNTPLIKISEKIWAKFEGFNPSGSIKDRMATYIINHAEENGLIKKGDTIIEATSGNSGIAFAFLGAERGYNVKIIMPSNMSEERKQMLRKILVRKKRYLVLEPKMFPKDTNGDIFFQINFNI